MCKTLFYILHFYFKHIPPMILPEVGPSLIECLQHKPGPLCWVADNILSVNPVNPLTTTTKEILSSIPILHAEVLEISEAEGPARCPIVSEWGARIQIQVICHLRLHTGLSLARTIAVAAPCFPTPSHPPGYHQNDLSNIPTA